MRNKQRITLSAITLAVILAGCSSTPKTNDASTQLTALLDSYQHESQSLDSTHFGIINDQMAVARQSLDRIYLDKLLEIERSALTDEEKVYYDTFRFDRTIAIRGASFANTRFGNFDAPVTHFYNYIQWNAEEAGAAIDDSDSEQTYQDQLTILKEYTSWVRGLHSQYQQATQQGIQLPAILAERLYQNSVDTISYNNFAMLKVGLNDLKTQSGYTSTFINQYTQEVEKAQRATQELLAYLHNQYVKSARGEGDIESESFRYAAYVGQAVSYKSGYLVIRELLEKAQQALGDKFEHAEFHDQLLRYGQQPMEVMKSNINNWISTKQQA